MGLRVMGMPVLACLFSSLLLAQVTSAAAETVKVSAIPIYPKIPRGQTSKDFQVLVRVEAPPAADQKGRVPIDLVAVLDVSDSMNDPATPPENKPSRLDLLKTATKFIIRKLDDGDRLSIVAFNDRPVKEYSTGLLDISGDGRSNAGKTVDRLEARGGTALMPGLEEAVKILDGRPADSRNRVGFIVLLTDGEDTSGFRWSDKRREIIHGALSKYPVHTFGLGAAHDPEALFSIAQESHGGTYSFVDDQNMDKITGALAVCLGGLKTVAAVDTRISFKAAELSGVKIQRIEFGGYDSRVSNVGASGEVAIGVLYAGEVKHFVVHLHVPASSSAAESGYCDVATFCDHRHHHHHQHLLAVGCSYSHAPGVAAVSIEGHGVFVRRPEVVVDDDEDGGWQVLPSPVVLQHMVRFELLEIVAGFVQSELSGYLGKVKHSTHVSNVLQSKWEEFRIVHQFWGGVDLGGLEKDVDAMVSSLKRGVAYVYSWVSTHQMQRATAMGSLEKVAHEFLTPAMRLMLDEAQKLPPAEAATTAGPHASPGCECVDFHMIDRRLELWSEVRREVPLMFQPSSMPEEEDHHLTAVFREASLDRVHNFVFDFISLPNEIGEISVISDEISVIFGQTV